MKLKIVGLVLLAAVVMFGAYTLAKPKDDIVKPESTSEASTIKEFVLVVKNRKLVEGTDSPLVKKNDTVTIRIKVDEPEELHIHGYDLALNLEKNKQASITFVADKTGNFPYELEHSKTDLGSLQVQP
ncbi:MAG TPA: hypothetical protein VLF43_00470 [Candidatus Saccharimonadales bacterium]|nr:hypothetical protein [Candidatus Saccharimonadales bacterium]